MPHFNYRAKKEDGSLVTGTLQAESERSALDALGRMGVFPLEVESRQEEAAARAPRRSSRQVRPDDIAIFTRQLSDLLRAGVAIDQGLKTLARQTSNREMAATITEIEKEVSAGRPLYETLSRFPKVFKPLDVSMVRAGETGGFLEDVLRRLASFIDKDRELRSRVKSALAYPLLLIIIGGAAVAFLMVFFIPRFTPIFERLGGELPWMTQVVMGASDVVRDYWMALLVGILVLAILWSQLAATVTGRRVVDRFKLRLPLFGDIVRKNAVARFSRTLGTLLRSGVPILTALSISKEAMGNTILMEDIDEASAGVRQGRSLAEILKRSRYFPTLVVDMIAVGETAGNLDEVLVNVADSYEVQVDRAVRVFITLFEPALLVFMAALVGFIVISMLLPVFTLAGTIA